MTSQTLTAAETATIRTGYGHLVDNGFSAIESAADVIRVLEVQLERARRELAICKGRYEENQNAETVIMFLEPMIRGLQMRAAA